MKSRAAHQRGISLIIHVRMIISSNEGVPRDVEGVYSVGVHHVKLYTGSSSLPPSSRVAKAVSDRLNSAASLRRRSSVIAGVSGEKGGRMMTAAGLPANGSRVKASTVKNSSMFLSIGRELETVEQGVDRGERATSRVGVDVRWN